MGRIELPGTLSTTARVIGKAAPEGMIELLGVKGQGELQKLATWANVISPRAKALGATPITVTELVVNGKSIRPQRIRHAQLDIYPYCLQLFYVLGPSRLDAIALKVPMLGLALRAGGDALRLETITVPQRNHGPSIAFEAGRFTLGGCRLEDQADFTITFVAGDRSAVELWSTKRDQDDPEQLE